MKVWKRFLATAATTALMVSMVGCTSKPNNETDKTGTNATPTATAGEQGSETQGDSLRPAELDTIKVILFGEESPRMAELMENEFQQIFIDEINTKVELLYLPWTENGSGGKVDLMIASGQDFDAAIVDPNWAASSVSKGYLQDLTSVIDKYLPDWKENMNEVSFDPYRFDGGIYAIPVGNKPTGGVYSTVCVRQDIMDEIGMTDISSLEDLTAYATAAKEKYGLYATYDIASTEYIIRGTSDRNLTPLASGLWIDQDTKEIVSFAESEEFEKAVKLYNEWYANGLIPKDMLTNTVTLPFQAGLTSFFRGTCGTTVIENEPNLKQVVPEAYTKEYYISPEKPIYKKTYESTAIQVPVSSTKADRVAMFVNLLQKNTELADAFIYGIEGTDYEVVDNKIVATNKDELFYQWMVFNVNISTFDERFPDDFIDTYRNWDNEAIPSATFGFTIDYEAIKSEKAQIESIWTELAQPMLAGIKDYDSNIDELVSELKSAGFDKYVAEIQRQLDEHLAK